MAPKKKPVARRGSQNPNTVLVIFLIFFILAATLAGIACYYGYQGQEALKEAAKKSDASAKVMKEAEKWAAFQARWSRLAVGGELNNNEQLDEVTFARNDVDDNVIKADGSFNPESKYKSEPAWPKIEEMFKKNKEVLGWDPTGKKYLKNYRQILDKLELEVKNAQAAHNTVLTDMKGLKEKYDGLEAARQKFFNEAKESITAGNAASLAAAQVKTKEMDNLLQTNNKLLAKIEETNKAKEDELRKKDAKTNELSAVLEEKNKAEVAAKDGKDGKDGKDAKDGAASQPGGRMHALILDVSKGKALWDTPIGKIVRVNPANHKVYINLGRVNGIKSQQTFNVFSPGWSGRAEGPLKGTIEVLTVIDANSSVARVTSLYDMEGREISFNEATRGTIQRQGENPMKEGDLLYSLTWGARVAIAGNVAWDGFDAASAADQLQQLRGFMNLLAKEGVVVDAWLDPTDGKVKGAITARTNYLIRGEVPYTAAGAAEDDSNVKQAKSLLTAMRSMQEEAVQRGIFVISADNFMNVVGYRRPRAANETEVSSYRPTIPAAGAAAVPQPEPKEK